MAIAWPPKPRLLGKRFPRLDGPAKSTGKARYSFDINLPGMLHAMILRCPHARAIIKSLDTTAAEAMPGVKAVHLLAKVDEELYFAGQEIVGLAAATEEQAHDALRAIKITFEVLPFVVKEEDALKGDAKTVSPIGPMKERQNVRPPIDRKSDDFEKGLAAGTVVHEGEYGVPTINHQCLESHGLVASWDQEGGLTVYASTQAVTGTAKALSVHFQAQKIDLPESKVKCITHYMGGGFGSKFGPDIQGICAAELARKAKAPVKLMLDRAEEVTCGGTRPSARGKIKIAATKDGKVTAYEADTYGTPGIGNGATVNPQALPYVYPFENKTRHVIIRTNTQTQRAMRAPGHPQNCFLTEGAIDDLAAKLGMDPLQVRLLNLPQNDAEAVKNAPTSFAALRNTIYKTEIGIAAELANWKKLWHPPGKTPGPIKHGIGMAIHTWGGQASPQANECTIIIAADGSVTAQTSSQDLGTAQRTVNAIVAAEILGLEPGQITVRLGESPYGLSTGSGGSTTCPSQAPATLKAVTAARDAFLEKIAPKLPAKVEDLTLEGGKVVDKKNNKTWEWKQACARLGMEQIKADGKWTFGESIQEGSRNVSGVGVGGVQIAEVMVDTETGVVRCTKVVAVQDCGLIVNKLGCESQVAGGVIMGMNYALFEERIMDRITGRQVNANMEFYKLGGIEDMPHIIVHMHDMPERGVIGIGEPPTISTHAAIGNAIFNAIGVRVPETPFTPDRVLAVLARGGK